MNIILLILGATLVVVAIFMIIRSQKTARELSEKTQRAVSDETFIPIEFHGTEPFLSLAIHFNILLSKLRNLKSKSQSLTEVTEQKDKLTEKVRQAESSSSEVRMFTEMGRQITQALNVESITSLLFKHIEATCDLAELELWVRESGKLYNCNKDKNVQSVPFQIGENSIQKWVIVQHRIAKIGDNAKDFSRYVYEQVRTSNGNIPASVTCVELYLGELNLGTLTLYSYNIEAFSDHLTDFFQSLASYTAVALVNAKVLNDLEAQKDLVELEKGKSDALLLNILPKETAEELKETGKAKPRRYESVTVLFTDFKNFTNVAEGIEPEVLIAELDYCFRNFDEIAIKYGVEKIKTIGDAWLGVCGLPVHYDDHALRAANAAIEIRDFLKQANSGRGNDEKLSFNARIGLHSGALVAGVVGKTKFAFDIWGDTVNTAARMEQSGEVGKVNVSGSAWNLIETAFNGEYRGKIEAKNKGAMDMYFIERK